jgi:hypothetical protein
VEMNKEFVPPVPRRRTRGPRRERSFELSLPGVVRGTDALGRRFEERTATCSLSAQEATFRINAPLLIGAKVNLALEIPRTLILEKPMKLQVSGAIVYVRSEIGNGKVQLAIVRLERGFKLISAPTSLS